MSHRKLRLVLGSAFLGFLLLWACLAGLAHDVVTTPLTWDGQVSRIVYARCASCHRQGGTAFSLTTYQEARPWAKAIKTEVLERRMPPWGAVKGFGEFRNDQALTQEQVELIANWVEGGAPEGNPNDLPPLPKFVSDPVMTDRAGEIVVSGDYTIRHALRLDGLWPKTMPNTASVQITAELPSGAVKPLVWLHDYKTTFSHPFFLRQPLLLPVGSVIHGVPPGSSLVLFLAAPAPSSAPH